MHDKDQYMSLTGVYKEECGEEVHLKGGCRLSLLLRCAFLIKIKQLDEDALELPFCTAIDQKRVSLKRNYCSFHELPSRTGVAVSVVVSCFQQFVRVCRGFVSFSS